MRFGMAEALELNGDRGEAIRFYRFLAENSTADLRDDACFQAGQLLYRQGQYSEAVAMLGKFDDLFRESPLRIDAKYWTGISRLELDQPTQAAAAFNLRPRLAEDHPLAADFEFGRGKAASASGVRAASDPPVKTISAWPRRICMSASPIAWVAEAQALLTAMLLPFAPK